MYQVINDEVTVANHSFVNFLKSMAVVPSIVGIDCIVVNLMNAQRQYKFRQNQNTLLSFVKGDINSKAIVTECTACDKVRRLSGDGTFPLCRRDKTKHKEKALYEHVL